MARKLILLALAGTLGLAVTGVASAHWFNVIRGARGDDTIAGTTQRDFVLAFAGNDQVSSGDGRDIVYAGNSGRNRLHGGPGDDTVNGGSGRDFLWGGRGVDHEYGGDGNDVLHALAADGQVDALDCGPGNRDVAWLRAGEADTTVNCELVKTVTIGSD